MGGGLYADSVTLDVGGANRSGGEWRVKPEEERNFYNYSIRDSFVFAALLANVLYCTIFNNTPH